MSEEYDYKLRVSQKEIKDIYYKIIRHYEFVDIMDAMPVWILVLNKTRQVVYYNSKLANDICITNKDQVLGKRPGELFNCQHAWEEHEGCGTSKFCQYCGAVQAIMNSHLGVKDVQKCNLLMNVNNQTNAVDLEVTATPTNIEGEELTIFSVLDISFFNRSLFIEKTFLHDIGNTVAAIISNTNLIADEDDSELKDELIKLLIPTAHQLMDEIYAQQEIRKAELGEWEIEAKSVSSLTLIDEVINICKHYIIDSDIKLELDKSAEDFILITESVLLKRVIINMLKNAIEASASGESITILCKNINDVSAIFSVHNLKYIPENIRLQLFHRSFSTKGKGRGLGTYSIKLLTENYLKGEVAVQSDQEHGTVFSAIIPLRLERREFN